MKRLAPTFVAILVSACATSGYSYGRDFSTENVAKLVKGKTTAAEVRQLFGEPYTKGQGAGTSEKWLYVYGSGQVQAQSVVATTIKASGGHQKSLEVYLDAGVVTDYYFNDTPIPASSVH